jgi:DNA-binding GntR family transcriptional regulator
LRKALEDMAAAHDADDSDAFMDANYRFRSAWMELLPNQRLARVIELFADHVRYLRAVTLHDPMVRAGVTRRLTLLLAALMSGDGDAAAQSMREHLLEAKSILMAQAGTLVNDDGL